ncbi:aromatic amino acid transaminase [Novosphingobium kaempferiae]|uniref:aromatic amino acid transaminase n=1 Tax=Novosphingobium kaempferiae TaxID=2896849 RepID=UPI001E4A2BE5|nr:aromatic amino acid transaminase [Novosphingobium kaempferiae]
MFFNCLNAQKPDPLLSLIEAFAKDQRPGKLDLSVGVYRDDHGRTPVMRAVKLAEERLVRDQASKSYLGPDGDRRFAECLGELVLGRGLSGHARGIQTVGGTGALSVAAGLLGADGMPRTVWLATPTWSNHLPLFAAAGLPIRTYSHVDEQGGSFALDAFLAAAQQASPGDAFLLQGCGHNPTGIDPDLAMWREIGRALADKGLIPLIDLAYQGFGVGVEEDARGMRDLLGLVPEAVIAVSCNKTFGLYRDRVGALLCYGNDVAGLNLAMANARASARSSYSMPPDHGAAVVRTILDDAGLAAMWREELDAMRNRLRATRRALAASPGVDALGLGAVAGQGGMFCLLPLDGAQVERLRSRFAIFVAPDGRVNLAALPLERVGAFTEALADVALRVAS